MTIKSYLKHLEQIKQDLLALNLPDDTRLVNPLDMGNMIDFGDCKLKFTPQQAFVYNNCCYANEYLMGKQLTEKENVVVVRTAGYSRK